MNKSRLKVMTIVGTRPEIIRLSRVISLLDEKLEHILVHTGQNYDYVVNLVREYGKYPLRLGEYDIPDLN